MSLASPIQNQKVKGQPAARRYQRFRDQHGRRLGSMIELKTGDPTCTIEPLGWTAPLMPPMKYIEVKKDEDGAVEVGQLFINYIAWIKDAQQERTDWDDRIAFFAQAMWPEDFGPKIADPPAPLRRLMKGQPQAIPPIYAAMKGDRWLLGFEKGECPEYLRPYFTKVKVVDDNDGELELDLPEGFVEKMEAAFAAAQVKKPKVEGPAIDAAERARIDAEMEAAASARRTAAELERGKGGRR